MAILFVVCPDKTLILGFGSDALSDDGLPLRLVHELQTAPGNERFDFNTSPVGGLELLELLRGYNRVILIDTQLTCRRKPGTVSFFTPDNFEETFHLSSQHDLSFHHTLKLAKDLDIPFPSAIHVIAIEISENKKLSFEFSDEIKVRYSGIFKIISKGLAETPWN